MILFTTKKATAIYRLISSLLFIVLSFKSFASEDLVSFCFTPTTNIEEAQSSLSFLLLPREKVFLRKKDSCFDVLTSTDRSKLLEKFLSKRYTLVSESNEAQTSGDFQSEQCQIEMKTTKVKKLDTREFRAGKANDARATTKTSEEVSTSKLLLGLGRPGALELEGRSLYIECRRGATGVYQLLFSYSSEYKNKVTSEVSVRKGEPIQVAQVTNDLAAKSKTLGLPQSLYEDQEGQENISYELKVN